MSGEILGWLGIGVSVVLFILGLMVAPKLWRHSQSQKIDRGGRGYQAGGDINVDGKS